MEGVENPPRVASIKANRREAVAPVTERDFPSVRDL